jgi:lipooligosaccharide transport system ATP-binding protein
MPSIVVAENLVKRFGELKAVNGISFAVEKGELFGFLGPNGAGKTTTMKMIQCVSPKTSGSLSVAGLDVEGHEKEIKGNLGVVPQENNLDPDFTTYQNLMVYSRYFNIPKKEAMARAKKLLKFVQLWGKRDVEIEELSGGMKRRLILARALINNPRVLILDEPTLGLDPQGRHLIWEKLRQLKSEGVTIIMTTHYMDEAAQLCDRLAIMNFGRIITRGEPRDLVKKYAGATVVETSSTPQVLKCLKKLKVKDHDIVGGTARIFTENPKKVLSALIGTCGLGKVTVREATLEDVFIKLTGKELVE